MLQHQRRARRRSRGSAPLAITLAAMCLLRGAAPAHAQGDVLILGPTVSGGTSSLEYRIVTSTGPIPGYPSVTGLGLSADVVSAAAWTSPPKPYSGYRAIVLGDPSCSGLGPTAAAEANAAAWAAAVTGNVVIIGTDPSVHPGAGGTQGAQLWRSAIQFAASGTGTGAVIALSCYYHSAAPSTPVNVLNGFGSFTVSGNAPCAGAVAIVASSPALTGLTGGPTGTLSNWSCSVHEWFNTWPASFIPLAIATDITSPPPNFTAADGTRGHPYILARGVTAIDSVGVLKICKVAGPGVPVGMRFDFSVGGATVTVPAGPAPGGYCAIGPRVPVGTVVTVREMIPTGYGVSSITVMPGPRLVGAPDLPGGRVRVTIGDGVTEVTYTDEKRTGFLEICKRGDVRGNFTFTVDPGGLGPFTVPAGACSPAIEVPAGLVRIRELPVPGAAMSGCATIPAGRQGPCDTVSMTSTVTVVAGDVSTQTIAMIANRRVSGGPDTAAFTRGIGQPAPDEECAAEPTSPRGRSVGAGGVVHAWIRALKPALAARAGIPIVNVPRPPKATSRAGTGGCEDHPHPG